MSVKHSMSSELVLQRRSVVQWTPELVEITKRYVARGALVGAALAVGAKAPIAPMTLVGAFLGLIGAVTAHGKTQRTAIRLGSTTVFK